MTRKWYATLRHPKMHPHTKFRIPTSKNIGDMDRTRKRDGRTDVRMDRRTDGQCDYYMPPKVSFGGIKSYCEKIVLKTLQLEFSHIVSHKVYKGFQTVS